MDNIFILWVKKIKAHKVMWVDYIYAVSKGSTDIQIFFSCVQKSFVNITPSIKPKWRAFKITLWNIEIKISFPLYPLSGILDKCVYGFFPFLKIQL